MVVPPKMQCPLCGKPYETDVLVCDCRQEEQGSLFPVDPTSPEATASDDVLGLTPVDDELFMLFDTWGRILAEYVQHPAKSIDDIRQQH